MTKTGALVEPMRYAAIHLDAVALAVFREVDV